MKITFDLKDFKDFLSMIDNHIDFRFRVDGKEDEEHEDIDNCNEIWSTFGEPQFLINYTLEDDKK